VLIFGTEYSLVNRVNISQNHSPPGFGRHLWRTSNPTSLLTAGAVRAGCPGLCPFRWVSPRMETLQRLCATCCSVRPSSQ